MNVARLRGQGRAVLSNVWTPLLESLIDSPEICSVYVRLSFICLPAYLFIWAGFPEVVQAGLATSASQTPGTKPCTTTCDLGGGKVPESCRES